MHKVKGEGKEEESGPESLYNERNLQHFTTTGGASATKFTVQRGSLGAWGVGGCGVPGVLTSEIYTEGE
jgi:hypothetical protein